MTKADTLRGMLAAALMGASVIACAAPALADRAVGAETYARSLSGNYLAGLYAGAVKDIDAAVRFYERALDEDPDSEQLVQRTFLLMLATGRMDRATELAERIVLDSDDNKFARLALGVDAMRDREWELALSNFESAADDPLTGLTLGILEAWAMQGQGKTDAALARLAALDGPGWYDLFVDYHSGLIAEQDERLEEAAEFLENASLSGDAALRVVLARAHVLARLGRDEEVDALLGDISGVSERNPLLQDFEATRAAGGPISPYVADARAGAAEILYGLGTVLGREGGEEVAAIYLRLALRLREDDPYALVALAGLYEGLEQFEDAAEIYARVPLDASVYRIAETQRALNLDRLERTEEALDALNGLTELDPEDAANFITIANIQRSQERFAEAAETYSQALALMGEDDAADWTIYYFRGISYERAKEWEKAEADLLKALELEPEQPLVLNYLGYSWIDQNMHLEEGLDMVRRAVAQRPEDGYIVDSLGWAYYRLGRYDDAVEELEKAVLLRPADPTINDHLGDAYWQVGRRLEARFQWSHALDLDPDDELRTKVRVKLATGLVEDAVEAAQAEDDDAEVSPPETEGAAEEVPSEADDGAADEAPASDDVGEAEPKM